MSHLVYDTVTPHLRIGVRGSIPYFCFHFSLFFQFSVLPFFIFWYFSFFLKKNRLFFILALTGASPKTLFLTPFFLKARFWVREEERRKVPFHSRTHRKFCYSRAWKPLAPVWNTCGIEHDLRSSTLHVVPGYCCAEEEFFEPDVLQDSNRLFLYFLVRICWSNR